MKSKYISLHNFSFWCGLVIILSFLFIFGRSTLTSIYYSNPHFDDAYNATVSANYLRHGEYRVSYPEHIVFHNKITTGVPMLLPLVYIYKWFGISTFTTEIQSVIYGLLAIILIWILLSSVLNQHTCFGYLLAAFLALMIPLSNHVYYICSIMLIGEIAALCYILVAVLCLYGYYCKKQSTYLLFSGVFIATSFLTKSAMIFFVVSWFGIILIESLFSKQLTRKAALTWIIGFILGFILVDSFKFFHLGGFEPYYRWWIAEWHNMISQSDGTYHPSLLTKFNYLETELYCNKYLALLIILLAPIPYCYCLYKNWIRKESVSSGLKVISISGITGDSLLIYSLLFGNSGLMHAKRLIVNTVFVKILFVFFLGLLLLYTIRTIKKYYREKNTHDLFVSVLSSFSFFAIIALFFPSEKIKANIQMYSSEQTNYVSTRIRMEQMLQELKQIPLDVPIYTDSWLQEPCVSLFLDRDMINYKDVTSGKKVLDPEGYFLAGFTPLELTKKEVEDELQAKLIPSDSAWIDNYILYTGKLDPERETFVQLMKYKIVPYSIKQ